MNLHDDTVEDTHHGGNIQQVEDQRLKSTKIIKKHNQRLKTSVAVPPFNQKFTHSPCTGTFYQYDALGNLRVEYTWSSPKT